MTTNYLTKQVEYTRHLYETKNYIVLWGLVGEAMLKHFGVENITSMGQGVVSKQNKLAGQVLEQYKEHTITLYELPERSKENGLDKEELTLLTPYGAELVESFLEVLARLDYLNWQTDKVTNH